MHKKSVRFLSRLLFLVFLLISLFSFSPSINKVYAGGAIIIFDQCTGVDHFWDPADYPRADPTDPLISGSPSLGWMIFAFDPTIIPPGSEWHFVFQSGWTGVASVEDDGRAFFYYGLWNYGDFPWESTITAPDGTTIDGAPSGIVVVNENENLDCDEYSIFAHPTALPATPTTLPATVTPIPTDTPVAEIIENNDVATVEEVDEVSFWEREFGIFGYAMPYLYCLCILLLLIILIGGTVIIVIRRNRTEIHIK